MKIENTKLTDFGSARNVNLLMTNMTFTKGIGTPKYMAPEILNKGKYKKSADIYSFAITMFETFNWDEAYPPLVFRRPWDIANFVSEGKRLGRPEEIPENIYAIIEKCWAHHPDDRITAEHAMKELDTLKNNILAEFE